MHAVFRNRSRKFRHLTAVVCTTLSVIAGTFGLGISATEAASVEALGLKDEVFHVVIRGPIEAGDAARLDRALEPSYARGGPPWYRPAVVHLDSPGGNLKAALEVIEYILDSYLATEIDRDANCFSACALIFMSGNGTTRNFVETYLNRRLHVSARLGFHAPYVPFEGVGYNAAVKQIADILRLLDNKGSVLTGKPFLKRSLITELLLKGPNESFNIDTVDKAGRWDIELFGYAPRTQMSLENFKHACANVTSWKRDNYSSGIIAEGLEGQLLRAPCREWDQCKTMLQADLMMHGTQVSGVVNDIGCRVEYRHEDNASVIVRTWEHAPPQDYSILGDYGTAWWLLPPDTKLSQTK